MAESNNDINIVIKYSTEGEEEVRKAQEQTADLGKETKEQAVDVSKLTQANKAQTASMKNLGSSAVSLASKFAVFGTSAAIAYKVIKSAAGVVLKYTAENDKLRSSIATLSSTVNTQANTMTNYNDTQNDVKDVSDTLNISQQRVNDAVQYGTEKTNNYELALQTCAKAYDLAGDGVGTFEENYNNLIDAYTGDLQVFDRETGAALQAGVSAYETYYKQVNNTGDKGWGDMLRKQYAYEKASETLTQQTGESLQGLKGILLGLFTEVDNALANFDWKELINLLIIDPINGALYVITSGVNTVLGLVNKLFGTNLSINSGLSIPRLESEATKAGKAMLAETSNSSLPDYVSPYDPFTSLLPGSSSPTVNVQVEGSVWTTQDLATELSGILFDNIKLRGAR